MAAGLLLSLGAQAQVGQKFPELKGETVSGKSLRLPQDVKGKFTLLGLAFSKKSDDALQTWFQPTYDRFMVDKESAGLFADFVYDVNVYFVPMFTGANKAAAGPARKSMLKNVDAELHPHVLFYIGELAPYRDQLGLVEKDEPYFFVLDESGKIVYATSGAYSEQKMDQVEEILSEE
ncbi:ATP10 protein [Cesiribacter andamanensis AMV16]|uniref:ATP10 protein n=2 Tax=Cesiribacter TaxID=1133570 RepID=M7N497_9BACT|nr:ATP10 protein [Cesiribacter andamanensis AMV16]